MKEESIFAIAAAMNSVEDRAAYLERVCGDDTGLRARIEQLLQAHDQPGSLLDQPAGAYVADVASPELRGYLNDVCGDDPRLRADVEALLLAHRQDSGSSEAPAAGSRLPTVDINRDALNAGLAATFAAEAAVVIGDAGHSVLQSLGKQLPKVPHVMLREPDADEHQGAEPESKEAPRGQETSRYQLHGEIARGGMGAIIRARDADLGRDLAIKVLLDRHKDDPDVLARFIEEAQIGGQLQHPGIVPVHELGQFVDQRPYFSMKLVEGETLASLLSARKDPSDDLPHFLGIFEHVCQTMAYAHSRGVIHRDLKPANVMVGAFGEVQVMDWGLAKVVDAQNSSDDAAAGARQADQDPVRTSRSGDSDVRTRSDLQTQMGSVMGTPAYMPPEQAQGKVGQLDERTDVFGLGAILCQILTGKPPYEGDDTVEVYRRASQAELDDCLARLNQCGADKELVDLAKAALAADPTERLRDAGVVSDRVSSYLEGVQERLKQTEIARAEAQTRVEEEARRKKLYLAIAGLMLVLAAGGAIGAALYKRAADTQKSLADLQSTRADEQEEYAAKQKQLREQAEREEKRAIVMRLAAESKRIKEELPQQSVLLAMEAVKLAKSTESGTMPIAHETLLAAVSNLGGKPLFSVDGRIGGFLISDNDRLFRYDGSLLVTDLSAEDPRTWLVDMGQAATEFTYPLAISRDGRKIVTHLGGFARVWDLNAEGDLITSHVELPCSVVFNLAALSQDNHWLVTLSKTEKSSDEGVAQLWDLEAPNPAASAVEVGRVAFGGGYNQLAISADNRWVVTVDTTQAVLWDLESDDPAGSVKRFEHTAFRSSVAFSPNSRWLAIGTDNGTRLLDLDAEDILAAERLMPGEGIRCVTFSPDHHWLATAGRFVRLFSLTDAEDSPSAVVFQAGGNNSLAFSLDCRWLVSGFWDGTTRVWDLNSIDLTELPNLRDSEGNVTRVWSADTTDDPESYFVLRGHEGQVKAVAITSDGRRLITGGWDGKARIWNLDSDSPDSSTMLARSGGRVADIAFSPNGRWLAAGAWQIARLWDLTADDPTASSMVLGGHQELVRSIAFSADNHWLVTASGYRPFSNPQAGSEAHVWDLTAPDPRTSVRVFDGRIGPLWSAMIGPHSRWLVTETADSACVWDLDAPDDQTPRVLGGHEGCLITYAFGPDGNSVLTGSQGGIVRLWDLTTEGPITPSILFEHEHWIISVDPRPDRLRVLTGGWQLPTHFWELEPNSGKVLSSRAMPRKSLIWRPFPFSSDGRWLATGREVWDLTSSDPFSAPALTHHHDAAVHGKVLSPDGSWFASTGEDHTPRVSHLLADDPSSTTLVLRGHDSEGDAVAISPDNCWLVSGSADGVVHRWDLNVDRLMERAQQLVGRKLTRSEREKYLLNPEEPELLESLTPSPADSFTALFDGTTLAGWKVEGNGDWQVEDGCIVGRRIPQQERSGRLVYMDEVFDDVEVSVECRINNQGNSGVNVRTLYAERPDSWILGYQAQITNMPDLGTRTGGIYGHTRFDGQLVEADAWFTLNFRAVDNELTVFVNGKPITRCVDELRRFTSGRISLEATPGTTVHFRKVGVRRFE